MKENKSLCRQAGRYYYDFLSGDCKDIPPQVAEHLAGCQDCRIEIERLRCCLSEAQQSCQSDVMARNLADHNQFLNEWISCFEAKPFLLAMSHPDLAVDSKTPITIHIEQCPHCRRVLKEINQLCLSQGQVQAAMAFLTEGSDGIDLPLNVRCFIESLGRDNTQQCFTRLSLDSQGRFRVEVGVPAGGALPRSSGTTRRMFLRSGLAAGFFLAVSLCFLSVPKAGGVAVKDVYKALAEVETCRIRTFIPEQTQAVQTILFSKKQALLLFQDEGQIFLWNSKTRVMLDSACKQIDIGLNNPLALKWDTPGLGLMPFEDLKDLPADYSWKRVDSASPDAGNQDVYELRWFQLSSSGIQIPQKWIGYLNHQSLLPEKIECWTQLPGQTEQWVTRMVVDYPSDAVVVEEIKCVIPGYQGDQ